MFRLTFSLGGLLLLALALGLRGLPKGPAMFEIVGITIVFFGGSALWSGWQLWKQRTRED